MREPNGSLIFFLFQLFQPVQNIVHQVLQLFVLFAPAFVFFALHVLWFRGVQFRDLGLQRFQI